MADQSIKSLYTSAESKRNFLETSFDSNTETFRENLAAAIATYDECRRLADRLSLFSPNESLEDITSGNLQYLLINYHLGELFLREWSLDRKAVLQKAREAYERYLGLLSHYDLFTPVEKKTYDAYIENPTQFSTISTTNFEARRAAKIANFRLEKQMKKKLEFLAQNPAYLQSDEDAVRELQITNLALSTHNTWQSLEGINRELEILAARPPTPPSGSETLALDYRERNGTRSQDYSDKLDRPLSELLAAGNAGPILDKGGKPLRPFTLLDNRQHLQNGVFRPGHNLPTMTIDEYLEEERLRGGIIEGGGEASGINPEVDEDNFAKSDAETLKAREWDEFVEANPKGSGNTLNRG